MSLKQCYKIQNVDENSFMICFHSIYGTNMSGSSEPVLYKKGENSRLDKELARYRKMRIWRGHAIYQVFTEDEIDTVAKLWRKERLAARTLTVEEVSRLVEFAGCIQAYRAAAEREKTRQRMERSREKVRKAKRTEILLRPEQKKKAAKKRAKKYKKKNKVKNI